MINIILFISLLLLIGCQSDKNIKKKTSLSIATPTLIVNKTKKESITEDYQQKTVLTVLNYLFPNKEVTNNSTKPIEQITINLFVSNRIKQDVISAIANALDIKFYINSQKITIYDN